MLHLNAGWLDKIAFIHYFGGLSLLLQCCADLYPFFCMTVLANMPLAHDHHLVLPELTLFLPCDQAACKATHAWMVLHAGMHQSASGTWKRCKTLKTSDSAPFPRSWLWVPWRCVITTLKSFAVSLSEFARQSHDTTNHPSIAYTLPDL